MLFSGQSALPSLVTGASSWSVGALLLLVVCKSAAYGASAKGATLLNSSGIGRDRIEFVADRNPYKQGRYLPGGRIPIVGPSALVERSPDYALLLTWNFADEILAQQAEYRQRGGKFIVPVPRVETR